MATVFGMHALELQPGCDENEFEEFMRRDFLPSYSRVSGQTARLLKGDRGERTGKYMVLIELESPERRDQIYPSEGVVADDVLQLVGDVESLVSTVRSFLVEFPDPRYTDYVVVSDEADVAANNSHLEESGQQTASILTGAAVKRRVQFSLRLGFSPPTQG